MGSCKAKSGFLLASLALTMVSESALLTSTENVCMQNRARESSRANQDHWFTRPGCVESYPVPAPHSQMVWAVVAANIQLGAKDIPSET